MIAVLLIKVIVIIIVVVFVVAGVINSSSDAGMEESEDANVGFAGEDDHGGAVSVVAEEDLANPIAGRTPINVRRREKV